MLTESLQRIDCVTSADAQSSSLLQVPGSNNLRSDRTGGDHSAGSDESAPRSPKPSSLVSEEADDVSEEKCREGGSGHSFYRKSFSKPAYCHHCGEVIWSPLSSGFVCDGERIMLLYALCI